LEQSPRSASFERGVEPGVGYGECSIHLPSNVDRTIPPIMLNCKNALFAGHEVGAQNWAMLTSLIETCKLNVVEPQGYISGILTAIVHGCKQRDIEDLLPWNYIV